MGRERDGMNGNSNQFPGAFLTVALLCLSFLFLISYNQAVFEEYRDLPQEFLSDPPCTLPPGH